MEKTVVIASTSALTFHRHFGNRLIQTDKVSIAQSTNDPSIVLDLTRAVDNFGPLHVVVDTPGKKGHRAGVVCHTCGLSVPKGTLYSLREGIDVVSIGMALVQAALKMDDLAALRLCYELCADYRMIDLDPSQLIDADGNVAPSAFGYVPCKRLISLAELKEQVTAVKYLRGAKRVLDLLEYVAEGAASPREVDLAMYVWSPRRLGGYAFPMGVMNHEVDVDGTTRSSDLLICGVLALEYDSDEWHGGILKNSRDSARKKQLELHGFKVVSVTNGELRHYTAFFDCMRLAARYLGRELNRPTGRNVVARMEMHRFVNTFHERLF